ncbi:MAG TPA: hypothetical protein VFV38_08860 [Ktedonobacteraceae bacterium]|nr:hypothetical protein [Ktedonobacteraceae bacterium]
MAKPQRSKSMSQLQREMETLEKKGNALRELEGLWTAWMKEFPTSGLPARALNAVDRAYRQLAKEINAGKTERIAERFDQAKELAIVSAQMKRRVTYLQTLDAVQELLTLARDWQQETPRSRSEQTGQLHLVRRLLLEIANGHVADLPQRFQQPGQEKTSAPDQESE